MERIPDAAFGIRKRGTNGSQIWDVPMPHCWWCGAPADPTIVLPDALKRCDGCGACARHPGQASTR